jgi:hypothetical protein
MKKGVSNSEAPFFVYVNWKLLGYHIKPICSKKYLYKKQYVKHKANRTPQKLASLSHRKKLSIYKKKNRAKAQRR